MCEDEGVNFVIDNIDIRQNVKNMTEENQNVDCHWVYLASPQGQGHHNSVSQLLWACIT